MNTPELKPGSTLRGNAYRIVRTLGQGGFGITYLAEQVMLEGEVAIKEFFMKDCCERDGETSRISVPTQNNREVVEKFKGKFIREARMIFGLKHPNIVRVLDVFEENGTAYYVMDILPGGSLADKVRKQGPLSEAEACRYIRQVASALDYIHSKKLVHLDVKPSNILLNSEGEAVLIDFGVSKHYDSSGAQTSSTPVGISVGYAPLEQGRGGDVSQFSASTDIYALGATLYHLLTGKVPPEASLVFENGGLDRPEGMSDNIWNAISKSMEPHRKARPQCIKEFLDLLGETPADAEGLHKVPTPSANVVGTFRKEEGSKRPVDEATVLESEPVEPAPETPREKPASRLPLFISAGVTAVLVIISLLVIPKGEKKEKEEKPVKTETVASPKLASAAEQIVREWNQTLSAHDLTKLETFYLPNCKYYLKRYSPSEVIGCVSESLGKYPNRTSTISDLKTEMLADDVYRVSFFKVTDSGDGNPPYTGQAYLQLEYRGGLWHIVVESDPVSESNGTKLFNKLIVGKTPLASDNTYEYYWTEDEGRNAIYRRNKATTIIEPLFYGGIKGSKVLSINADNHTPMTMPEVTALLPITSRRLLVSGQNYGHGTQLYLFDPLTGRGMYFADGNSPAIEYKKDVPYIRVKDKDGETVYYDMNGKKRGKKI